MTELPKTNARFTMAHNGSQYACEVCGDNRFRRVGQTKARCADEACGIVYSVEYSKLDIDVIYYKGWE